MKKFVTILVPTDFSASAKAAAHYAAQLAMRMKAKVILLSVIEMDTSEVVLSNWKKLENQLKSIAKRDLEKLLKEVKSKVHDGLDISYDMDAGIPMEAVIERYAREKKVNLIVMGTKGATGLKKMIRGTNTARVIEHSSIPVIAIPTKATFKQIKKIVYASDLKNVTKEIQSLSALASLFQAEILILHTVPAKGTGRLKKNLEPEIIEAAHYSAISYHQVTNDRIGPAISKFVDETKADMLAMFTHELDFYEKLFGQSVTRAMAFESRVPLLVFNRSNR
jgi:nucleotide-binding universal stress UspA family protein